MHSRYIASLPTIFIMPLVLGIGIGIGGAGVASAVPITNAVAPALTVLLCATTGACATVTNSKKGTAVLASSPSGIGIKGSSQLSVGVDGESIASVGVFGNSVKGDGIHGVSGASNGVVGISSDATAAGVIGKNTHWDAASDGNVGGAGVQASSIAGSGLIVSNGPDPFSQFGLAINPSVLIDATGTLSDGIDIGTSQQGGGPDNPLSGPAIVTADRSGTTANIGGANTTISAINESQFTAGGHEGPGTGIQGSSRYGNGLVGSTESGPTANAVIIASYPIAAVTADADRGADLYVGYGTTGTFEVTNDGNVNASGTLMSGVTCVPTTCPSGIQLAAYTTRETSPTIEDLGRGQLVNGAATVLLDSAFMGTIDSAQSYYVFLTAEGETRGLYVANRKPRGFTVGENLNGHSTVAFSYRIVAAPYGLKVARLPVLRMHRFAAAAFAQQRLAVEEMKTRSAKVIARTIKSSTHKSMNVK